MMKQTDNRHYDQNKVWADVIRSVETMEPSEPVRGNAVSVVEYQFIDSPPKGPSLAKKVGRNVIPVALIGAGAAWLAMALRESSGQGSTHSSALHSTADGRYEGTRFAGKGSGSNMSALDRATVKMSQAGRQLKQRASIAAEDLRQRAIMARRELRYKANEIGARLSVSATEVSGRTKQIGERTATQVRGTVQQTQARLGEFSQQTQARLGEFSQQSQAQIYRAKDNATRMLDEQPLVIAALGAAIGIALAVAIPGTRRENELLGETRDNLFDRVKSTALEQAEVVKESAMRVAEVAKEEVSIVAEAAKNEAQQVASNVTKPAAPGM